MARKNALPICFVKTRKPSIYAAPGVFTHSPEACMPPPKFCTIRPKNLAYRPKNARIARRFERLARKKIRLAQRIDKAPRKCSKSPDKKMTRPKKCVGVVATVETPNLGISIPCIIAKTSKRMIRQNQAPELDARIGRLYTNHHAQFGRFLFEMNGNMYYIRQNLPQNMQWVLLHN